jgi:hypothetical protein
MFEIEYQSISNTHFAAPVHLCSRSDNGGGRNESGIGSPVTSKTHTQIIITFDERMRPHRRRTILTQTGLGTNTLNT